MRLPPVDLTSLLVADEGEVLHVYLDSRGVQTLGVGRRVDELGGISNDESRYMLGNDVQKVKNFCALRFPWLEAQSAARIAVVQSMCFIFGGAGLLGWPHFLSAMQAGDWEAAAQELETSKWAVEAPERVARFAKSLRSGEFV